MIQVRLFSIPVTDTGVFSEEMNRFLRQHKIMEISQNFVSSERGALWCFCVKYIETIAPLTQPHQQNAPKIDYMKVLDAETFKRFSRLREIRKAIASQEAIPVYTVFTDEELAELAKLQEITPSAMLGIRGIGDKKVARFAEKIINALAPKKQEDAPTG